MRLLGHDYDEDLYGLYHKSINQSINQALFTHGIPSLQNGFSEGRVLNYNTYI